MKILKGSENYTCMVVKLPPLEDVPGLDNLKRVKVLGEHDCLVGKDTDVTKLHLFFPAECKINPIFLRSNNLYRETTENEDKTQKGFFEPTGRVKALKFKGVISTGFVIPFQSLYEAGFETGPRSLKEGDEFNELEGVILCDKYKVTRMQGAPGSKKESPSQKRLERFDRLVPEQFRFHVASTPQLAKNIHVLSPSDFIVITDKWHGTSSVFANVLIRRQLKWYEKLATKLGIKVVDKEYYDLYASRTVIKNRYINKEVTLGYYGEDVYGQVKSELKGKIEQGITIYGEIVGFMQSGKAIQGKYDYGCEPKAHKLRVYRMTYTKPDGSVIELDWFQIQNYCNRHGLETVPVLYIGFAAQLFPSLDQDQHWNEEFFKKLQQFYLEKDCVHCKNKVPAEGICLRIDGLESFATYKLKSKRFLKIETEELDKGVVNIEDEQESTTEAVEAEVSESQG